MQRREIEEKLHRSSNKTSYLSQSHGFVYENSVDLSSSSRTASSLFSVEPSQLQPFLSPKVSFSSFLGSPNMNPFDSSLDLVCDLGFLEPVQDSHNPSAANINPNSGLQIQPNYLFPLVNNSNRSDEANPSELRSFEFVRRDLPFLNSGNVLTPLENLPPSDHSEATIFQRRMAQHRMGDFKLHMKESSGSFVGFDGDKGKMPLEEVQRRGSDDSDINESDELDLVHNIKEQPRENSNFEENSNVNGKNLSNMSNTSMVIGDNHKGKKKGPPAKNLMAERRRRKKLNDRLYTLRSIVPNISKMDRASILSDAIEYLKKLLQRIDELRIELEANPLSHAPLPSSGFDQLTATPSIREDHCPSTLPSLVNQRPRIEVRAKEGRGINLHMFSAPKPGLLLSAMRALENLGLDVQQAVISCIDGFALDVFHAEHNEGLEISPEQIKSVLLDTVGMPDMV